MPVSNSKYMHTNIVARDWKALAKFYQDVFGCVPVPPQRDYEGDWIRKVTGISDVRIEGMHLRVPGYGDDGPTLEIFQYSRQPERLPPALNRPGLTHLAFHVDDVPEARQAVLSAGGSDLGEIHTMPVSGAGTVTLIYMTDPEGNVIELQTWS